MNVLKRKSVWNRYHNAMLEQIAFAKSVSEAQMEFKADEFSWSLRDLFEHLYQVEYLSQQAMAERIDSGVLKPSEFKHRKRYWRLTWALMLPKKYPVPKAVKDASKPTFGLHFISQWEEQHTQFEAFLECIDRQFLHMLIFRHPIAGPLNADQTLGFLYYHLKHHRYQMKRIVKHPAYPKK